MVVMRKRAFRAVDEILLKGEVAMAAIFGIGLNAWRLQFRQYLQGRRALREICG